MKKFGLAIAPAGLGLAAYAGLAILSVWGTAERYTPAGLLTGISRAITGESMSIAWPVIACTTAIVVLFLGAVAVFRRREL